MTTVCFAIQLFFVFISKHNNQSIIEPKVAVILISLKKHLTFMSFKFVLLIISFAFYV